MQILPTRWLLAGVAALLVLAAPASAQTPPITASFTANPEKPALGESVELTATSTGGTVHAWDLDDDGAFDDAGGAKAKTRFDAPGLHTVRLRTTNALYGNSATAAREFTIDAAPTPTPTPTPSPTATPVQNQPPVARLDRECKKVGSMTFCSGHIARQGTSKRISAAPSSDPDGQIVRYEWDIGGDGVFETDTGTTPHLDHVFEPGRVILGRDHRKRDVRVRVTDDQGATAETGFTVDIKQAACVDQVKSGALTIEGACLRPNNVTVDGNKLVRYLSSDPVTMGGIAIAPRGGQSVAVDVGGAQPRVASRNAAVSMAASGAPVELFAGRFEWKLVGGELRGFSLGSDVKLNGLKVTGLAGAVKWASGRATAKVHVALPDDFGAPTSDEPITLGGGANASAAAGALKFSVPSASLGPIALNKLDVSYDGVDLWEIEASVSLPAPAAVTIDAGAGIRSDGRFHHAEAEARFDGGGIPIGGPVPVFLQRIKFRVEMSPKKSECVPYVGVMDLRPYLEPILGKPLPKGMATSVDFGVPTFAMCGEIGLTAGPSIGGKAAVRLDAGLGWATYADRPWVLRAFGKLSLVEIPVAEAKLAVHGDGYITINGKFEWGIPSVASIKGGISVEMLKTKFNASGRVDACLDFVDLCVGARAIVSSKGLAACLAVDLWLGEWNPGIGYKWGASAPKLYFSGCDIGDYKVKINRARAAQASGAQGIDVAAGLPGTAMVFKGAGTPPHVTLVGPKGERISSPTDGSGKAVGPGYMLVEDPGTALTHVLIAKPSAGRWEVTTHEGSSPIVEVQAADGLEAPAVKASVGGRGRARELRYSVDARPGQKVTFVERSGETGGQIGVANATRGSLRFSPADGPAGKRSIVALIEQDGQPRAEQVVATYVAPRAAAPARVRGLKVRGATARWSKSAGAVSYEVQVRRGDGQTTVRHTSKRSLRVPRSGRVRVAVRPVGASGMDGPRVTARR